MLPPITIARSLPVCPTLAVTVFVMRVCLLFLLSSGASANLRQISRTLMGQNTRTDGLFLKCAGKSFSLAGKNGNIFGPQVLSNWNFFSRHIRSGGGINSERACLEMHESAF